MIEPLIYLHKLSLLSFSWLLQILCLYSMTSNFSDSLSIKAKFYTFFMFHQIYLSFPSHHPHHFPSSAFLMVWKALRKRYIRKTMKEQWCHGFHPVWSILWYKFPTWMIDGPWRDYSLIYKIFLFNSELDWKISWVKRSRNKRKRVCCNKIWPKKFIKESNTMWKT